MKLTHPDGRWIEIAPAAADGYSLINRDDMYRGAARSLPTWLTDYLVAALLAGGWQTDLDEAEEQRLLVKSHRLFQVVRVPFKAVEGTES